MKLKKNNSVKKSTLCTLEDLVSQTPESLPNYLQEIDYDCLNDIIWDYEPILGILTNEHVQAVNLRIEEVLSNYQGENDANLFEMFQFIRIFYYHSSLENLGFESETLGLVAQMLTTFTTTENIFNNTELDSRVLSEAIIIMDTAELFEEFIPFVHTTIDVFNNDEARWSSYRQRVLAYNSLYFFQRSAWHVDDSMNLIDGNVLASFVMLSTNLANDPEYYYLPNNAIWALGKFLQHDIAVDLTYEALEEIFQVYESPQSPYLEVLLVLDLYGMCPVNSITICRDELAPAMMKNIFSNSFSFDGGNFIVRTPLLIEQVQNIYLSSKEVKSQFFRLLEDNEPVTGDPNESFQAFVYGSRADYETYQRFLFGLNTNNGGIYIEGDGTFYTYERTPSESIYTLLDLFRHEYVHYLVGRYVVEGMWGQTSFYNSSRLTWFDEGIADFLAGSDQYLVNIRKVNAEKVEGYNNDRYSMEDVFDASYSSGWKFYTFSAALFNYLHREDKNSLKQILQRVRSNDIQGFDDLLLSLESNEELEAGYQDFLTFMVENVDNFENLVGVTYDYPNFSLSNLEQVTEAFQTVEYTSEDACNYASYLQSIDTLQIQNTATRVFRCQGVITGASIAVSGSIGNPPLVEDARAWVELNARLNTLIDDLQNQSISSNDSFDPLTCFFKNITVSNAIPFAEYQCEGLYTPVSANQVQ